MRHRSWLLLFALAGCTEASVTPTDAPADVTPDAADVLTPDAPADVTADRLPLPDAPRAAEPVPGDMFDLQDGPRTTRGAPCL